MLCLYTAVAFVDNSVLYKGSEVGNCGYKRQDNSHGNIVESSPLLCKRMQHQHMYKNHEPLIILLQAPPCIFPPIMQTSLYKDGYILFGSITLLRRVNTEGAKHNKFLSRKYRNPHNTLACPYFIFFLSSLSSLFFHSWHFLCFLSLYPVDFLFLFPPFLSLSLWRESNTVSFFYLNFMKIQCRQKLW